MKRLLMMILLLFVLTACSEAEEAPPPVEEEPTAVVVSPTNTPVPPTNTPEPELEPTEVIAEVEEGAEPVEEAEPDTEMAEERSGGSLEIFNASDVEICDIAITPSDEAELGENLLDEALPPEDGFILTDIETGLYDLIAFDCEDEVVGEEFEITLGEAPVVWEISDSVQVMDEAEQPVDEVVAEPEPEAEPETENTETINQDTLAAGEFEFAECPFDYPSNLEIECGWLTVPSNRTRDNDNTLSLTVAILRAADEARPDPIIFLDGGPGGSALTSLSGDIEGWIDYPFHQNHDMIFIDQRGTGWSIPSLNCPEVEEGLDNAEQACQERLIAEGIDLTAFNTAENAADIADLWQTLGYEEVNLFGVSYGTRLGLAVMRDHPEGIRSVVLDSPFPPNIDLPTEEGVTNWQAIQALFAACQTEDPLCAEAYPDLETRFLETVDQLNRDEDGEIFGDDLVNLMVSALYSPDLIPLLPRVIFEVSEGNYETFDLVSADSGGASRFQDDEDRSDSEGMYTSVTCHDEYAFGDFERAEAEALEKIPAELQEALFYSNTANTFELCDYWGAGAAEPKENEAVVSDIPTLILAGQFDPVTPPEWGRRTAETLSNGYFFELPGYGHSLSSDPECPTTLITLFFENPTVEPDSSCIDDIFPPEFFLPDEPLDF